MRHKKSGRQFGRDTSSRRAMLRNLAANLITHERIETTDAKAKEIRRIADLCRNLFAIVLNIRQHNLSAFSGEEPSLRLALPACRTGNDCNLAA